MPKLHPLLDNERQKRARNYENKKQKLLLLQHISVFFLILLFILAISQPLIKILPESNILRFLIFLWVFLLFSLPADLLFSYLSTYRCEHQFGFSNQNLRQFWTDEAKNVILNLLISPLLAIVLFWSFHLSPRFWWLFAATAMILVSGIFATLYPLLILPLFNTYTPIKDEHLISRLSAILKKGGLKIKGFYMQDMSRQTKKENAFLGGLGKTRRVVLSDNILNNMKEDEIETVIAHEVGHYRHKHILRNILLSALFQLVIFFLIHHIMLAVYPDYLRSLDDMLAAFPLFILCFSVFNLLLSTPVLNAVSRHHERQADRYALELTGNPDAFIHAMAGLANRNLSNAYPDKVIKCIFYSHPPIGERLDMGEKYKNT